MRPDAVAESPSGDQRQQRDPYSVCRVPFCCVVFCSVAWCCAVVCWRVLACVGPCWFVLVCVGLCWCVGRKSADQGIEEDAFWLLAMLLEEREIDGDFL